METPRTSASLKQLAYDVLRDRILSLQLESNAAIFENEMAIELGISRTPVREALAALEREGLVRIVRGRGAFVAPTSSTRVMETYAVREVLEGLAASLAAGRVHREDWVHVRDVFEGHLRGEISDPAVIVRAADQLHLLIAEYAGNSHLEQELRKMSDQVRRLRAVSVHRTSRLGDSTREHLSIMDAIEQNDPHLADSLMRQHIRAVRISLAQVLGQPIRGGESVEHS